MKAMFLALALGLLAGGCGSAQRPVSFVTSAKSDGALDTVSRTLAAEGHTPANVDRQANIVQTEWKDTGYLYGQVQNTTATIVRRFTVTIAPANEGANVTVRIDGKRCPQGGYTVGSTEVRGTCEELTMIPGKFQEELDALGRKLQQALGTSGPAVSPAVSPASVSPAVSPAPAAVQ
jgi:hypothetical protein